MSFSYWMRLWIACYNITTLVNLEIYDEFNKDNNSISYIFYCY